MPHQDWFFNGLHSGTCRHLKYLAAVWHHTEFASMAAVTKFVTRFELACAWNALAAERPWSQFMGLVHLNWEAVHSEGAAHLLHKVREFRRHPEDPKAVTFVLHLEKLLAPT